MAMIRMRQKRFGNSGGFGFNVSFVDRASIAVFSRERFTTVTAYRGFVTKSQLLETLFTRN